MTAIHEMSRPYGLRPPAMHIDSIRLVNFRCHKDLTVTFNDRFNVVVAANGGGKTSLLRAISIALVQPLQFMNVFSQFGFEPSSVRVEAKSYEGRYRFEERYPVELDVHAMSRNTTLQWKAKKSSSLQSPSFVGTEAIRHFQQLASEASTEALPVFAFYTAGRAWPSTQPNHLQAALAQSSRLDGYESWWNASQSTSLSLWLISRCLERTQTVAETGKRFDDVQNDELALINSALDAVLDSFRSIKFDMKRSALLVEWSRGREPTLFNDLSDGQRSMIFLIADIARRICLLNPQLGMEALRKTQGVILIDELDVHLHPHWQRLLVRGLKAAFPSVQFITASHSPQIIGELHPDEIILLSRDGVSHPQVSYGLTSSQVLEEVMDAEARTPAVGEPLERFFGLLDEGKVDEARSTLAQLENLAWGVPDIERARSALRRREILGR